MTNLAQTTPISPVLQKGLFLLLVLFCLSPWSSPPLALLLGITYAMLVGNPFAALSKRVTTVLLQVSVVGLGFGIHATTAFEVGRSGFLVTIVSIVFTVVLGWLLGKWLSVEKKTSYLIACGTAICGGSAIAALAPVIRAEKEQISIALGTIFILNSVALFAFPWIGRLMHMQPAEFGLWAAIAIHDTSSVVGTASKFGAEALEYATTVKLVRALWIIPMAFFTAYLHKSESKPVKIPYFIGFFVLAILLSSYVEGIATVSPFIVAVAKKGLVLTLFLIGAGLSRSTLKEVGFRPFIQGCCLWIVISVVSLLAIVSFR